MKQYLWQGIDAQGIIHKGITKSNNAIELEKTLFAKKIALLSCKEKKNYFASIQKFRLSQKISEKELLNFFDQLAILISHGIPLIKSLQITLHNTSNPQLSNATERLIRRIKQGHTFSYALEQEQNIELPTLYLIKVGEQTGDLATALKYVANIIEQKISLSKKIKQAIRMPMFTLLFSCTVILTIFIFIIPQFSMVFSTLNKPLPAITKYILHISDFISSYYGATFIITIISVVLLMYKAIHKNKTFKALVEKVITHSYLLNTLHKLKHSITILNVASALTQAGTPIKETFATIHSIIVNEKIKNDIKNIVQEINHGRTLYQACAKHASHFFPNEILALIDVGETTGTISTMLSKASAILQKDLNNKLEVITTVIQPILLILIGIIIVFLMVAVYLPIFSIAEIV